MVLDFCIDSCYNVDAEVERSHQSNNGITVLPRTASTSAIAQTSWQDFFVEVTMRQRTPRERFDEKLEVVGDCWIWTAYTNRGGYGWLSIAGKRKLAHRVAWEFANGPIPDGKFVLHSCDTPPCCNPARLHLGSLADNNREMVERGRDRKAQGEQSSGAKLTAIQVQEIRDRYEQGRSTYDSLAREYNMGRSAIWKILTFKSWRHIGGHTT